MLESHVRKRRGRHYDFERNAALGPSGDPCLVQGRGTTIWFGQSAPYVRSSNLRVSFLTIYKTRVIYQDGMAGIYPCGVNHRPLLGGAGDDVVTSTRLPGWPAQAMRATSSPSFAYPGFSSALDAVIPSLATDMNLQVVLLL